MIHSTIQMKTRSPICMNHHPNQSSNITQPWWKYVLHNIM